MRNIIITLPKKEKWDEYRKELKAVAADPTSVLNFKIPSMPKESGVGARCYLCHDGKVKGWMTITGIVERDGFTCDTTGKPWARGIYVQRAGTFNYLLNPLPMKGFQGWHYYDEHAHQEAQRTLGQSQQTERSKTWSVGQGGQLEEGRHS